MKKKLVLFSIILILCMLCSCSVKPEAVKGERLGLLYSDKLFSISSNEYKYYTFYHYEGDFITPVLFESKVFNVYRIENNDFGESLRLTVPLLDEFVQTIYLFEEDAIIPIIEDILISQIIFIDAAYSSTPNWADHYPDNFFEHTIANGLASGTNLFEITGTDEEILMSDIIEFENQIYIEEIDFEIYHDCVAFIPKNYQSFFCGMFDIVEYGDEFYIKLKGESTLFKVQEEYQELFANQ